jgi:hypothetical protein
VVYVCPVNTDPGANYSGTVAQGYLSQPVCKKSVVGSLTGNNRATLGDTQYTSDFGGAANANVQDLYSAPTAGTSPTNNWYWTIGAVGTANVTTGIDVEVTIDLDIEFFEIQSPAA